MNNTGNVMWAVALIVVVAIIYSVLRYLYFIKHEHFVCPKCHYSFKPKMLKLIFSQNAVDGKIMRCPNCKKVVFLPPVKDSENKVI